MQEITEDQSLCHNFTCPGQGRECLVYNERTWCMCIRECEIIPHNRHWICDQNGTTHLSLCHLEKHACESGRRLIPSRCVPIHYPNPLPGPVLAPYFESRTTSQTAEEGDTVRLTCQPSGNPIPTIHWQHPAGNLYDANSRGYRQDERIFVTDDGTLTVKNIAMSDTGDYLCIAHSLRGRVAKTLTLTVQG